MYLPQGTLSGYNKYTKRPEEDWNVKKDGSLETQAFHQTHAMSKNYIQNEARANLKR
jgi:hypothetical protein